ncbi:TatD family hydrolase [Candidatus Falkowbacteria bacterium]|nr:TatD family hydrolase [Candidatus Falkowbacteria bacterium]
MLIDTHAHLNFNAFREDADEVIKRSLEEETLMINVGSDYKTSRRALDLANKYEKGVYAAVGLHPIHLTDIKNENGKFIPAEEFSYDVYEKMASFEKTVAIGEIGLDYYHISFDADAGAIKVKQKEVFVRLLELARRADLPAIIHCRQAHDDMLATLKKFKKDNKDLIPRDRPWGVMHCFSGDENLAWEYFSLGLIISFTGLITFSKQWDDLIRKLPSDKFMIETDCPYMTPEPFRGKRNEPIFVKYVAERMAEIKNLTVERVMEITTANARSFFGI